MGYSLQNGVHCTLYHGKPYFQWCRHVIISRRTRPTRGICSKSYSLHTRLRANTQWIWLASYKVRRWTNKQTLAQHPIEQDLGLAYRRARPWLARIEVSKGQMKNEGQDHGSTYIIANRGISDSRSKAWLWILNSYVSPGFYCSRSTSQNIRSSLSSELATS